VTIKNAGSTPGSKDLARPSFADHIRDRDCNHAPYEMDRRIYATKYLEDCLNILESILTMNAMISERSCNSSQNLIITFLES